MRRSVAIVVKGYPRLSETFIAQEILALERRGIDLVIVSLRRPTDRFTHPIHDEIRSPVHYLPEYLHEAPGRVLRAWTSARRLPGYVQAPLDVAGRPGARPHPQPRAALRPGGRARGGARPRRIDPRPLPAHARVRRALRERHARHWMELLRPRQGRVDDAGVGEARKARRRPVRGDLHPGQPRAPRGARALARRRRSGLPRPGPREVSGHRRGADAPRRLRPFGSGPTPLGRSAGGEEGLRRPAGGACDAPAGALLDAGRRGRRDARGPSAPAGGGTRCRRPGALAREPSARQGRRALHRYGSVRTRFADRARWRPRRAAERADGGAAPRRRLRWDQGGRRPRS